MFVTQTPLSTPPLANGWPILGPWIMRHRSMKLKWDANPSPHMSLADVLDLGINVRLRALRALSLLTFIAHASHGLYLKTQVQ